MKDRLFLHNPSQRTKAFLDFFLAQLGSRSRRSFRRSVVVRLSRGSADVLPVTPRVAGPVPGARVFGPVLVVALQGSAGAPDTLNPVRVKVEVSQPVP